MRVCFVDFGPHQPTCERNANYDIIHGGMDSLSLQKTLLERRNYAGDGMGVDAFCDKEVA